MLNIKNITDKMASFVTGILNSTCSEYVKLNMQTVCSSTFGGKTTKS